MIEQLSAGIQKKNSGIILGTFYLKVPQKKKVLFSNGESSFANEKSARWSILGVSSNFNRICCFICIVMSRQ